MAIVQLNKNVRAALLWACLLTLSVEAWAEPANSGFNIRAFVIEGNTLLPSDEVQAVVKPFEGEQRQFADVQKALNALEAYYRKRGYGEVLVSIPEQELVDGKVKLQVIEPILNAVQVQYSDTKVSHFYPEAAILAALPDLKKGALIHTADVSRNLQLVNENPAKQVEVVLRNNDKPGQLDAGVKVSALPPRKLFTTVDNTGTEQSGEYRMGFGIQHANLFGRDHVATLNYITPIDKPTDVNLYSVSYRLPIYAWGDAIDVMAAKSDVGNSTTTTVAGPLQFSGSGDIYGINYNLLLPRLGEYSQRFVGGFSYRQFVNNCRIGVFGQQGCGPSGENVTVMPATLTYSGQLTQQSQTLNFYLAGSHNIPGTVNGDQKQFNAVRPANSGAGGAPADYYLLKAGYSYFALLGADWQMRLTGNGQFTTDPLIYVEQFGLAGSTAVRGFWEREVTRDQGYAINTEVYTPDLAKRAGVGDSLRGLVFFDYGYGRNNILPGGQSLGATLNSVGAGLRFGYHQSFQLKLDGAYVLDGVTEHQQGDTRIHLSLYWPYAF